MMNDSTEVKQGDHKPRLTKLMQIHLVISLITGVLMLTSPSAAWAEFTLNLKDADLKHFIAKVADITGKTFVVDQRANNSPIKVTIISSTPMTETEVYEVFLTVLRIHGYAAVPSGNVVKIIQQVLAKQSPSDADFALTANGEQIVTQVIEVQNTSSEDLIKSIRPLLPQYGHMAALTTPNVLIVADHADNIRRYRDMIKRIDVADTSTVEIYHLEEAWVEDIVVLLEQLAPEEIGKAAKGPSKVNIVASERTNSLVLRGQPAAIGKITTLVRALDTPTNRSGTIQVVRLAHSDAKDLAEILKNLVETGSSVSDQQGQDVPVSIQADESINALVIRANPTTMVELKNTIALLDIRRLQVLIEAAVVEVTTDFTRQLGTELAVGDASGENFPIGLTAPSGTLAAALQSLALNAPSPLSLGDAPLVAGGRVSETSTSFAAIIRALSTNTDVELLSTPSITAVDNEEARIVAGQNVPFRTGSTGTGGNGVTNPFTTIERQDVGLTLNVTPHIHDGSLVRLEIRQEVSEVDPSSLGSIGIDGSADLITNTREIETTVLADNEEVVILGGLIRDKTTQTDVRVPILGNIPILGNLFKSTSRDVEKQYLLVFLRPTVLDDSGSMKQATERKFSHIPDDSNEGRTSEDIPELFDGGS
ncbi:MAG: type II secretion system protein GspD [Gammaproteobacteria bacterium]|nr:type II secretion system protein GspD [Gammaproteobacteria bacterium]OUU06370.1 MAG: type II secretion system protein GspD [Gammaproteobacteria bacterium TMED34]